ncbi:Hypothetical predicted protein [Mytilus galloprovincialis]|uniref:Uncharacterized protein n=1 Tax=Mytilus galloprovincialis TaxID=29158 RepID=A0A8B6FWY1_MYTGA|nr:Hypothetical predicted protein [Mytilus galloprovincialis]
MNLSAEQRSSVRKELLFANTICNEIRSAGEGTSTQARMRTRIVRNIVSGKTMKKYRMIKTLAQRIGLSRNKLAKVATKDINIKRFYRIREMGKHRYNVTRFLQRDENSRVMPGKADYVKTDDKKVQKRILTDYLSNLYHKFMMVHPTVKLSFTTFTRLRPKNILLTSFIRRDTCLCTKHQNMSFTLKAVKRLGIDVSLNAEKEVEKQEKIIQDMKNTEASDVVFSQWKRVKVEEKGRTKMTMKVVDSTVDKSGFSQKWIYSSFRKQMNEFKDHVTRIQTQYAQMKELKINLPKNHCIVHMDFAENYQCKSVEEIQSAYWNQTSVTIHPVVVYYKVDEDELLHKSIVVISDEMGHNSATVLSIIDLIIPENKQLLPTVECIHYWTDSPTSQYRNKAIFNAIANHSLDYGIRAKWNYWEAGHGKGPCDGIGGTSKRMADEAVRTGKVAIQDPHDFFAWTQSQSCSLKSIKFIFLPKDKCENKSKLLSEQKLRPVPGTMKLHAVAEKGNDVVAVRNTSCYCVTCLSDEFTCENWQLETVLKTGTQEGETAEVADEARETYPEMDYSIADYVAAIYLK